MTRKIPDAARPKRSVAAAATAASSRASRAPARRSNEASSVTGSRPSEANRADTRSRTASSSAPGPRAVVAEGAGDPLDHRGVRRDGMRLKPGGELDAVLEPPQEEVRVRQLLLFPLAHEAAA